MLGEGGKVGLRGYENGLKGDGEGWGVNLGGEELFGVVFTDFTMGHL